MISQPALKVLYRLRSKNFMAMLVGGAPRDLIRGETPRDFDVVTDATITQIRKLFRNSRTIGKRFPIVHTYFGDDLVEISSLKTDKEDASSQELILEDANRRDFTVNALFYDIDDFEVIDPLGALEDLEQGIVRGIGDHDQKFSEDPMRMLRALKLVVKQGFSLEASTEAAMKAHLNALSEVGAGRCYEEMTRVLLSQTGVPMLEALREYGLLTKLWPTGETLMVEKGPFWFAGIRDQIPIHYAQGSFSKMTHMMLWFWLYMESGQFKPSKSRDKHKQGFHGFYAPLGMPFSPPVIDAIYALSFLVREKQVAKWGLGIAPEVRKLIESYVSTRLPDQEPELAEFFKLNMQKGKGRRRRPPRSNPKQAKPLDDPHKGKRKRKRRRRRRKPKTKGE